MDATINELGASVVPVLRYRDLPAAIDWLCKAFGFEKQRITAGKNGAILFAQLTFGRAMVMVGPVRQSAFDRFLKQPDEIGGAETQVCYFFVADAHTHCVRARAAGAEIVFDIADRVNGGRSYTCRDPEGHLWNFGTYNPWRHRSVKEPQAGAPGSVRVRRRAARRAIVSVGLLAGIGAAVVVAGGPPDFVQKLARELAVVEPAKAPSAPHAEALGLASYAAQEAQDQLRQARSDTESAERAAKAARDQLAQALSAREAAELEANQLREQLTRARGESEAAEQAARAARSQAERARIDKGMAERVAREARRQLARERSARRVTDGGQDAGLIQGPAAKGWE